MTDDNLVFHVGYPKCGSSSIQKNLFNRLDAICYLSAVYDERNKDAYRKDEVVDGIMRDVALNREIEMTSTKRRWRKVVSAAAADPRPKVVSEEMLLLNRVKPAAVAERVHSLAPNANIMIVYRDRAEVLRSFYDMSPLDIWASSSRFVSFERWLDEILARADQPASIAGALRYGAVLEAYARLFGSQRVWIFNHNRLFSEYPEQARLSRLLGCEPEDVENALRRRPINTAGQHAVKKTARRILGPVHMSWFLPGWAIQPTLRLLSKFVPEKRTELTASHRNRIAEFYRADEWKLQAYLDEIR